MAGKSSPEFLKKLAKAMLQEDLTNGTSQVGEAGPRNAGIMLYAKNSTKYFGTPQNPQLFAGGKALYPPNEYSLRGKDGVDWDINGRIGREFSTIGIEESLRKISSREGNSSEPLSSFVDESMTSDDIFDEDLKMFKNKVNFVDNLEKDTGVAGHYKFKYGTPGGKMNISRPSNEAERLLYGRVITHEAAHAVQDQMPYAPSAPEFRSKRYERSTPYRERTYERLAEQQEARTYFPEELTSASSKYGIHPLLQHPVYDKMEFSLGKYIPESQRELLEEEVIRLNKLYEEDPKFRELIGSTNVSAREHYKINQSGTADEFNNILMKYIEKHSQQGGKK